jgi:hypothetical protein
MKKVKVEGYNVKAKHVKGYDVKPHMRKRKRDE